MEGFKRLLQPPSVRRSFKVPPARQNLPLIYMGWGLRRYGDEPLPLARNFGYVYAVVLEGSPTLVTDRARLVVKKGGAFILDLDCPMGWEDEAGAESRILIWIWRDSPTITALQPASNDAQVWTLNREKLAPIERIGRECRQELSALDEFSAHALQGYQRALDVAILRAQKEPSGKSMGDSRYEIGFNWMRHNLKAQHPVAELAVYLDVSESTLQRIFKRHTGEGPLAVFQALKAEEANRLLETGQSVKSVAFLLGYQHANDFTRFYTNYTGSSPTQR